MSEEEDGGGGGGVRCESASCDGDGDGDGVDRSPRPLVVAAMGGKRECGESASLAPLPPHSSPCAAEIPELLVSCWWWV